MFFNELLLLKLLYIFTLMLLWMGIIHQLYYLDLLTWYIGLFK